MSKRGLLRYNQTVMFFFFLEAVGLNQFLHGEEWRGKRSSRRLSKRCLFMGNYRDPTAHKAGELYTTKQGFNRLS